MTLKWQKLFTRKKKIKVLTLDIDGTLTDGHIYLSDQGELIKAFNAQDGFGIKKLLPLVKITPVVITGRESPIVTKRCKELDIQLIFQGIDDKFPVLETVLNRLSISPEEIAFIGDDLNDYPAMNACGFKACPADAVREIQKISDYVSPRQAGHGAVRDIIEHIIKVQGQWNNVIKNVFEIHA
jgi:3-deoxy-D-manno-octulosonate 8-phosphate phosphatase (KDO 8-P phosphatase)